MRRSIFSALAAALIFAACGGEEPDLSTSEHSEDLTTISNTTFENYPLGPLRSPPWAVLTDPSHTSRAMIVATQDRGKVLQLYGSSNSGAYLFAALQIPANGTQLVSQADIRLAQGASFVWAFHGLATPGSPIGPRRFELEVTPGTTTLVARTSPRGNTACGVIHANAWTKVTLVLRAGQFPNTFDVRIDGQRTRCTGITANLGAPFGAVSIMDSKLGGWGGSVAFDNLTVTTN